MLQSLISFIRSKGFDLPTDILDQFYVEEFGDLPAEWNPDQKRNVRKAVSKELDKYMDRFQIKPIDDAVEYLWRSGWEYKDVRGHVYGLEKWIANWVDKIAPADAMELSRDEQNDPYLKEVLGILKDFHIHPSPKECRMIIRRKCVPWTIRYVCELWRSEGKTTRQFSINSILKEAEFRWNVRNDRNYDSI